MLRCSFVIAWSQYLEDRNAESVVIETAAEFQSGGLLTMLLKWLAGRCVASPEAVSADFVHLALPMIQMVSRDGKK